MRPPNKGILLIDYQRYWREIAARALRSADFLVCPVDSYNYYLALECLQWENPDLVVLGCTRIGLEEQSLITQVLAHKHHLLVICAFLPWQVMRSLFVQGVDDIVDKTYDPAHLIDIVNKTLASIVPRNSYQAVEREGVA